MIVDQEDIEALMQWAKAQAPLDDKRRPVRIEIVTTQPFTSTLGYDGSVTCYAFLAEPRPLRNQWGQKDSHYYDETKPLAEKKLT